MSFNGSGVFLINTAGQPVVYNTIIDETVFNALTADLATGLSTAITKDGQTVVTANIPMAGYKITGLGLGTAATDAASVTNANVLNMCEFRLTLTTGVPVTTTDVTAAETLYWAPYKGNRIALYDGSNWNMRTSAELSIDVPDALNMYDVFVYDNAGTPALELTAWTNLTTRATALTTQNGVLVKTGALTRRYVGSFLADTTGNGQTQDSFAGRYVWNYYNRVLRPMRVLEATNSWNYTTATIRQANGAATNQLAFVIGYSEDLVSAAVVAVASHSAGNVDFAVGIGLDSTTAFATGCMTVAPLELTAAQRAPLQATLKTYPGVGYHYLAWLEYSQASGTTTWYGDNNGTPFAGGIQAGIHGEIWA